MTSAIGHYREGEELLALSRDASLDGDYAKAAALAAQAQAAFAAATAGVTALKTTTPEGLGSDDKRAWREACSVRHQPPLQEVKAA